MFKLKDKYKGIVSKYGFTRLDINGIYTKETWLNAGFKESILEEVNLSK